MPYLLFEQIGCIEIWKLDKSAVKFLETLVIWRCLESLKGN